jgi:hypothetical protein
MNKSEIMVSRLRDELSRFAPEGNVQECLDELSEIIVRIIRANGCNILMLDGDIAQEAFHDGPKPIRLRDDVARKRLEIPAEAAEGSYVAVVRDMDEGTESLVSAIVSRGKTVGAIYVRRSLQSGGFNEDDQHLFNIVAALVTKTIEVVQLQSLLKSRFTQIAIARSNELSIKDLMSGVMQNPNQIARILARSFYREMLSAGFNLNQILSAASEVISELSATLKSRSARQKRRGARDVFYTPLATESDLARPPEKNENAIASKPAEE